METRTKSKLVMLLGLGMVAANSFAGHLVLDTRFSPSVELNLTHRYTANPTKNGPLALTTKAFTGTLSSSGKTATVTMDITASSQYDRTAQIFESSIAEVKWHVKWIQDPGDPTPTGPFSFAVNYDVASSRNSDANIQSYAYGGPNSAKANAVLQACPGSANPLISTVSYALIYAYTYLDDNHADSPTFTTGGYVSITANAWGEWTGLASIQDETWNPYAEALCQVVGSGNLQYANATVHRQTTYTLREL